MKLFSKRHSERRIGLDRIRYRKDVKANELISVEARNRLVAEIKYLSSKDDYLEYYILFQDKAADPAITCFDDIKLDDFSLAELGYRVTDCFEFYEFKMKELYQTIRYATEDSEPQAYYDDYRLFDLAEISILFAKATKRKDVIARVNNILEEEDTGYEIVEHLITRKSGDDLKGMLGIIKDKDLKVKIERFFDYFSRHDYVGASKISAEIVNIIFSDETAAKIKKIEEMKQKMTKKLITSTSEPKKQKMSDYIDSILSLSKNLNNDIYDVRHTEKSTTKPSGDNLYKMIARLNLMIIELTITALKDDYVLSDDWENIKNTYTKKYNIDTAVRRVRKPRVDVINLDEIPF